MDTHSKYRWSVAAQRTMFCTQRGSYVFCTGLQGALRGSCPAQEAARWRSGVHTGTHTAAGDVVTCWKGSGSHVRSTRSNRGDMLPRLWSGREDAVRPVSMSCHMGMAFPNFRKGAPQMAQCDTAQFCYGFSVPPVSIALTQEGKWVHAEDFYVQQGNCKEGVT
jgi:hypothetical protein